MKGFFKDDVPQARDILLVDSGSPEILRGALGSIRRNFPEARMHLCTCWSDIPAGLASVSPAADYPSWRAKLRLLLTFRKRRPEILVIVCSKEAIMYTWKVLALALVPSKTLVVNENADYFWLDWHNRRALRNFLASRWVIIRKEFLLTVLRALIFPLTLLYLLGTALWLYARRWRNLLLWKIRPTSAPRSPSR